MTDALDALLSGGATSFTFHEIGDKIVGQVTNVEQTQQTDFTTKKPMFWDDGSPRMQFVFTLATDMRDPSNSTDDGARRIFAKGQMQYAITDAIREAHATKEQIIGGTLAVVRVEDGEPTKAGLNPPKQYRAQFKVGAPAATGDLLGDATPAAQPAAPPSAVANDLI